MVDTASKIICEKDEVGRQISWASECLKKILETGSAELTVSRFESARTLAQNKKQWPMLTDVANQVEWGGQYLEPRDWKDIFSAAWKQQELVPGINGGFVALGVRTSKIKKKDFCDLIEIIYAFGSDKKVRWSEPALKCYEQYREIAA